MRIMTIFLKFLSLPFSAKLEVVLYPLFLLWRMPIAWAKSLWQARMLLNGQWRRYMGFHPRTSLNSFYYRTIWLNLDRYGRNGVSPVIGLGAYPLRNWFHISLPSIYFYANAGAVTTLLGTLVWVLSHLIWIDTTEPLWVLLVTGTLLFSSTAYAMAFAIQNYQIIGWMWLPCALYAVTSEHWALASLAWLAASMGGITPIFFAVPVCATMALLSVSWVPIISLIPAILITIGRFYPLFFHGGLRRSLTNIAKLIGMTSRKVRYQREMNKLKVTNLYFFILYMVAALLLWFITDDMPELPLLGAVLFLINQHFFRVADVQSLIVLNVSLFTMVIIQHPHGWFYLLFLWLAASPFGLFVKTQEMSKETGRWPIIVNKPFDHSDILERIERFLGPVTPGESVYFAFSDPNGRYSNIFDGYRVILEVLLFASAKKGVHLFPDEWAVAETNYEGAPQCWGRSPKEVLENLGRWNSRYAIIYQNTGTELQPIWKETFREVSSFDWKELAPMLRGVNLWPERLPTPKWFLLELRP